MGDVECPALIQADQGSLACHALQSRFISRNHRGPQPAGCTHRQRKPGTPAYIIGRLGCLAILLSGAVPDGALGATAWEGASTYLSPATDEAQARCRRFFHVPDAAVAGKKDVRAVGDGWMVTGEDPQIVVDTSMLPGHGRCLRLDVSLAGEATIEIFFPDDDGLYSSRRSISKRIDAIETQIFVVLPDIARDAIVRIDPGQSRAGAITVEGLFAGEMPAD